MCTLNLRPSPDEAPDAAGGAPRRTTWNFINIMPGLSLSRWTLVYFNGLAKIELDPL
jgi:hypothetical protein